MDSIHRCIFIVLILCALPSSSWAQIECEPFPSKAPIRSNATLQAVVEHAQMDVTLHPQSQSATGRVTFDLRLDEPADSLVVSSPLVRIDSILAGTAGRPAHPVPFRFTGRDTVIVSLDPLADAGIAVDSLLILAIDFESRSLRFDDSTAWSLSSEEPWFPWPGARAHRFSSELMLTVPSDWRVVAPGVQTAERMTDEGNRTFLFSSPHALPAHGLGFVAGRFEPVVTFAELGGARRVAVSGEESRSAAETANFLEEISRWIAFDYPFDRYVQFERAGILPSWAAGLALAAEEEVRLDGEGFTWLLAPDIESAGAFTISSAESASMPVRQWVGTITSGEGWEDVWWEEALAVYVGALVQQTDLKSLLRGARSRYLVEAARYVRPLVWQRWHHPSQLRDEHARSKGTWVWDMLRRRIGGEAFQNAVADFVERNAFHSVGTERLLDSFVEVSGEDLTTFADDWIYAAGHPIVNVTYEPTNGGVRVSVEQLQQGELVPMVFDLDLALEIGGLDTSERFSVQVNARSEDFVLPFEGRPRYLTVDPDRAWLLEATVEQPASAWIAQLRTASTAAGRLHAAETLAQMEPEPALLLGLRSAFESEQDPEVRARIVAAFDNLGSEAAHRAILSAFDDASMLVRAAVIDALADDAGREGAIQLATRAAQRDPSSVVQASGVHALALLRAENAVDIARSALITPSQNDVIRVAGLLAFRQLHPRAPGDAISAAQTYSEAEYSMPTRVAAIRLLGTLASVNRRAASLLETLLSADTIPVRTAAAYELAAIGATDVLRDRLEEASGRFRTVLGSIIPCE